jgi:hypothetical protein
MEVLDGKTGVGWWEKTFTVRDGFVEKIPRKLST